MGERAGTAVRGVALVRPPGPRLAEGLVTHLPRTPVDLERARAQHAGYVAALAAAGWDVRPVRPAEDCPDAVFVEDTVVVCGGLAVLTRPGAPTRRPEVAGTAQAVAALGLPVARIEPPGVLDGGDVLQIGTTVYVGLGGRTDAGGADQLRAHLATVGRTVVGVPLGRVLHLKSAATALPDGTVLALPELLGRVPFPSVREAPEPAGCHVLPLGGDRVLLAASAPRTADLLRAWGFTPVPVDIGEFEKLEGSVTCLSVLVPGT